MQHLSARPQVGNTILVSIKHGVSRLPCCAPVSFLVGGCTTGFEGSATGGEGPGIERFRAQRGSVELSPKMSIDNIASIMPVANDSIDDVLGGPPLGTSTGSNGAGAQGSAGLAETTWRHWTAAEFKADEEAGAVACHCSGKRGA